MKTIKSKNFLNLFFWFISLMTLIYLYYPALKGTPIWDDYPYWFNDYAMKPWVSYETIWKNYAWPMSVSVQKILLNLFNKKFVAYHSISLFFHFVNSYLVYLIAKRLGIKNIKIIFLLFLFHPIAAITTAWMIQLKTLLSFNFAFISFLLFLSFLEKKNKQMKRFIFIHGSWFFFALSMTSKSSAIALPLIFFIYAYFYKKFSLRQGIFFIPFFIISSWGGVKILSSEVTIKGASRAEKIMTRNDIKHDDSAHLKDQIPDQVPDQIPDQVPDQVPDQAPDQVPDSASTQVQEQGKGEEPNQDQDLNSQKNPSPSVEDHLRETNSLKKKLNDFLRTWDIEKSALQFFSMDYENALKSLRYYFWQAFIPLHNPPIRGLRSLGLNIYDYAHFLFIILLFIIHKKSIKSFFLLSFILLLIPFLGLIPAPFMNVTWVSDQHLYLALPFFLFYFFHNSENQNRNILYIEKIAPVIFLTFYMIQTQQATSYYKNQTSFYEASLKYNPLNVPIVYNLALEHIKNNHLKLAYQLVKETIFLSQKRSHMKENPYYPLLLKLYVNLEMKRRN